MIIEFSENDLKAEKIVEPAWYRVQIDSVEDKMANDNVSTNSWIKGHILFNSDTGSKAFEGVPTPFLWLISSKGAFAAVGIFAALGVVPQVGVRLSTEALVGKQLDCFIGNGLYKGAMQNTMPGQYRAPRAVPEPVATT